MSAEIAALAFMLVLALVYVLVPTGFRNKETGMEWNVGPRDDPGPPMRPITGRLMRAKANLFETLPIYIAAVLILELLGRHSTLTLAGAWAYPLSRVAYLPLYAAGVKGLRSLAWAVGLAGIVSLIVAAFLPA